MDPIRTDFPWLFEKPIYWPKGLAWPPPLAPLGPERLLPGLCAGNPNQNLMGRDLKCHPPVVAGILLWFGDLDQSHEISQDLSDSDGAYWHGLMHRREPDHGNAAYWFRRVGPHPIHGPLGRILDDGNWLSGEVKKRSSQKLCWDMFWMNDLCKKGLDKGSPALVKDMQELQWAEYRLLLDYSAGLNPSSEV